MKTFVKVTLIAAVAAVAGCKDAGRKQLDADVHVVPVDLRKQDIHTSALFSHCTLVALESNDSTLLKEVSKSYLTKDYLLIKSGHALFIFDRNGRFVRKIEKIGNGPGEYARLSDFDVDEDANRIYILDKAGQKVLEYNFQGEYQAFCPVGIWAIKVMKLDKDRLCLYSGNEDSEANNHKLNLWNDSSFVSSFLEIAEAKKAYLHVNSAQNFYWKDGKAFFYEAFNDTVYSVEHRTPVYYIRYKHAVPPAFYEKGFDNIMDFFQEFNQLSYTNSTYDVFETDRQLYFTCYNSGTKYFNVYTKDNGRCESYNRLIDDMLFHGSAIPFAEDEFELWTNRSDEIVYYVSPQYAKEHAGSIADESCRAVVNRLTDDSNPVAVVCKLKE